MANETQGKRIAILAAYGVERVELEQPREAVQNAGARLSCCRSQPRSGRRGYVQGGPSGVGRLRRRI